MYNELKHLKPEELQTLIDDGYIYGDPLTQDEIDSVLASRGYDDTIHDLVIVDEPLRGYKAKQVVISTAPIRTISTGAMQRRFTIAEEVFITSDSAATVIKSRLLNASYCDLDFQDTIDGVNYICDILAAGAVIVDVSIRSAELLVDGTEDERYP
jgi:hypothetical protein